MDAGRQSSRVPKGSVKVIVSHDCLQLRFRYKGRRHYLRLGLSDTPVNRKVAEAKAKPIELDIISGNFDATLSKYRLSADAESISEAKAKSTLWELLGRFLEYKEAQCRENTMRHTYSVYTNYARVPLTYDLERAAEIRNYALKLFPWIQPSDLLPDYLPVVNLLRHRDGLRSIHSRVWLLISNCLNRQATKAPMIFSHLLRQREMPSLLSFSFWPVAALLKRLHFSEITSDCKTIIFYQAVMNTYTSRRIREGLKTQERRTFPCNRPLQELLRSIRPEGGSPNDLVFPSRKEHKPMDLNNLRNRAWTRTLKGLGIEYCKLYQTRHTFITLALEARIDAKDVARLVGNSPEVIYRHYADKKCDLSVPEF